MFSMPPNADVDTCGVSLSSILQLDHAGKASDQGANHLTERSQG